MTEPNTTTDYHGTGHPSRPGIITWILLAAGVTGGILVAHWEKVSTLLP